MGGVRVCGVCVGWGKGVEARAGGRAKDGRRAREGAWRPCRCRRRDRAPPRLAACIMHTHTHIHMPCTCRAHAMHTPSLAWLRLGEQQQQPRRRGAEPRHVPAYPLHMLCGMYHVPAGRIEQSARSRAHGYRYTSAVYGTQRCRVQGAGCGVVQRGAGRMVQDVQGAKVQGVRAAASTTDCESAQGRAGLLPRRRVRGKTVASARWRWRAIHLRTEGGWEDTVNHCRS